MWQGDITTFSVDAMVRAASPLTDATVESLSAISRDDVCRAGGPEMLAEMAAISSWPEASCVVTKPGRLPAGIVIHAIFPATAHGQDDAAFKKTYMSLFEAAERHGVRHVSIPLIPVSSSSSSSASWATTAELAFRAMKEYIDSAHPQATQRVTFVACDGKMYDILQEHLFSRFPDELDDKGY